MNNQNLLEQLRDIHYPASPAWWPIAPGWYLLLAIALILAICMGIWAYRYFKKMKKRKEILEHFDLIKEKVIANPQSAESWSRLSSFLKQFTLLIYPRKEVGNLHGEAWLNFLNEKGQTKEFTKGVGALLVSAPYQMNPPEHSQAALELIENWIRKQIKEKL